MNKDTTPYQASRTFRKHWPPPYIALSGGFDPIHIGHVQMIQEASRYANVIIILNSDAWLRRKKGYVFMPWKERAYILQSIYPVCKVESVDDSDGSVCEALERLQPTFFGNGGDRKSDNVPEVKLCKALGIELVWNLGGEKVQSSSELIEKVINNGNE